MQRHTSSDKKKISFGELFHWLIESEIPPVEQFMSILKEVLSAATDTSETDVHEKEG